MRAEPVPTRRQAAVFATKVALLRTRRAVVDRLTRTPRHPFAPLEGGRPLAELKLPLLSDDAPEERPFELGKIQNLRVAARRLDGLRVLADGLFSFWRQVGRCTRRRGYVPGRQIQEGCLIPSVGGGLCLLSNALYSAARAAGFEIVERHPHTRVDRGSLAERGEDATVAWNHIDLRIRAPHDWRLEVTLTRDHLVVRILGTPVATTVLLGDRLFVRPRLDPALNACGRCGVESCHRQREIAPLTADSLTVSLDLAPEFSAEFSAGEVWTPSSPSLPRELRLAALQARLAARRACRRDGTRAAAELARAAVWAEAVARPIPYEVSGLRIDIRLLPWLWKSGALGGREYEVLTCRPPLSTLHAIFDAAAEHDPDRRLLRDFRAPETVVEWERLALIEASRIVSPHPEVVALFSGRTGHRPWKLPEAERFVPGDALLFPGPTHARKGAYEVREVARLLGLPLRVAGANFEGAEFWAGIPCERTSLDEPFIGVRAVIAPSLFEERPSFLLRALASGVPVVTTPGSGLCESDGARIVAPGDVAAIVAAL